MDNSKKEVSIRDLIEQEISKNPNFFEMDMDTDTRLRINLFLKTEMEDPTQEDLTDFIDRLLDSICRDFEDTTERKDVRTRINEFNLKIYTIKSNPYFARLANQELFGKVLSYLQIEDGTDAKSFVPSIDEKRPMSQEELKKRDYEIRKRHFKDIIDLYGTTMPTNYSDDMIIIDEALEAQTGDSIQLELGHVDVREAAYITRILFGLGYKADFDDVKNGYVCARKIPLIMEKRKEEKSGQQLGKESIGAYRNPALTDEVYDRIMQNEQALDDIEMLITGKTNEGDSKYDRY